MKIGLLAAVLSIAWSGAALAASSDELDALHDALALDELIAIVADEGRLQSDELQREILGGRGGSGWNELVNKIYSNSDLVAVFREAFDKAMREADVAHLLDFYDSDVGERVRRLEIESRRAIISDEVEEAAEQQFAEISNQNPARLQLLTEFVEVGDLIGRNVEGAMNSNLAFYRGLSAAGGFEMSESEMLSAVWSQETEIRSDTESWIFAYLTLAYATLEDAELRTYIDLTASKAGKDLNKALFAGFYAVFEAISFRLGKTVSVFMVGDEL